MMRSPILDDPPRHMVELSHWTASDVDMLKERWEMRSRDEVIAYLCRNAMRVRWPEYVAVFLAIVMGLINIYLVIRFDIHL